MFTTDLWWGIIFLKSITLNAQCTCCRILCEADGGFECWFEWSGPPQLGWQKGKLHLFCNFCNKCIFGRCPFKIAMYKCKEDFAFDFSGSSFSNWLPLSIEKNSSTVGQ